MRRRLSVALLVPEPVATEIQGLRRALGDPTIERYVPHITLVPPVNVNETRLEEALALVRRVAASHQPLRLTIGPAGTFLPRNPVTFLKVDEPLTELQSALFVDPFELEKTRPFVPHVTIGRNETNVTAVIDYVAEVEVDRLHVMERNDDGSWFPIADIPFGEPAVVGRGGVELELTTSQLADPTTVELVGRRKTDLVITARLDGKTAGVAIAKLNGSIADLAALVVNTEFRNQGIGSQILKQFIHEVRSRRMKEITTECTKADGVFETHGFVRDSNEMVLRLKL